MTKHMGRSHNGLELPCGRCPFTTSSVENFHTHLLFDCESTHVFQKRTKELHQDNQIISSETSSGQIKCNLCPRVFNSLASLRGHRYKHFGKDRVCQVCGYTTKKVYDFNRHELRHKTDYPFKCGDCDKGFITQYEFHEHRNVHTAHRPYQCEYCGVSFSRRSSLVLHRYRKHPELFDPSKRCSICNTVCINQDTMAAHMITHTEGRRRYYCDVCGKGFLSRNILKIHRRSHTGEKPYECTYCGRCFSDKKNLTVHKRLHTGERPYSCNFCQKSYTKMSALKAHQKTHCRDETSLV